MQNHATPQAARHNRVPSPRHRGLFGEGRPGTAILALASISLAILVYGKMTDLLGASGEDFRTIIIVLAVVINMIGASICLFRGMVIEAIITFAGLLWIFHFVFIFSLYSGIPFTFSAGGEYLGYTYFGLMSLVIKDKMLPKFLNWLFTICVIYAVYYIIANIAVQLGILDTGSATRVFVSADDAGRSDRLYATGLPVVFGLMIALSKIRQNFSIKHIISILLFIACSLVASSRLISALMVLVIIAYFTVGDLRKLGRYTLIFMAISISLSLSLIYFPDLNPFIFATDNSGLVRVLSLYIASDLMSDYWITGAGISFGIEGYMPITNKTYFFPGDIGFVGLLFEYGVFGFAFYCLLVYVACTAYGRAIARGCPRDLATGLALTGITFSIYSLQSPQFDCGASPSILAMVFLALAVDRRGVQHKARAAPALPHGRMVHR